MRRSFFLAPVLGALAFATVARAESQLDAPVYYVQYEVTMKVEHTGPSSGMSGATTAWNIERVFESTIKLDMRNPGQVLSMLEGNQIDPAKYAKMSTAEQLKYAQQMTDAMQYTANWMPGPVELGDAPDAMMTHMQAVSVPVRIHYDRLTTGNNLASETGGHFDYFEQASASFNGGKVYTSPDQAKFELNSASKKYWLSLPYTYQDLNTTTRDLKWLTVMKHRPTGTTAWGPEERKTDESLLDYLGQTFKFDPLPNGSQMPLIEGTLPASGPISGVKSFTGHMDETGPDVPVTLTYQYTVTTTPPARAGGAK